MLLALEDWRSDSDAPPAPPACESADLLVNQPTTALMIPPDHMERIQPLLQAIRALAARS